MWQKVWQNMAIRFYVRNEIGRRGDAVIRFRFSFKAVRFESSASIGISPSKWDDKKQRVRKGCSNGKGIPYTMLNAHLDKIASFFSELEGRYILDGSKPTKESIKAEFAKAFNRGGAKDTSIPTLARAYVFYLEAESGTASKGTYKKKQTLLNYLQAWNSFITLDALDAEALLSFQTYCADVKGLNNEGVRKQISMLRGALRWCEEKGMRVNEAYKLYKANLKSVERKVFFLEVDELERVMQYEFPERGTEVTLRNADGTTYTKIVEESPRTLNRVRDMFCFCCVTSLRFSDMCALKWANIKDGQINYVQQKTSTSVQAPLNAPALAILERYKGMSQQGGKIFDAMSNQKMNKYLKVIGELCEINSPFVQYSKHGTEVRESAGLKWEFLSTHAGRKTFVCYALKKGVSPTDVMKITGHSDYKAMRPYIDVTDEAKKEAMSVFNDLSV